MYQNLIKKLKLHVMYLKDEIEEDVDIHPGIREILNHIYSIGYNDGLNGYTYPDDKEENSEEEYEEEEE